MLRTRSHLAKAETKPIKIKEKTKNIKGKFRFRFRSVWMGLKTVCANKIKKCPDFNTWKIHGYFKSRTTHIFIASMPWAVNALPTLLDMSVFFGLKTRSQCLVRLWPKGLSTFTSSFILPWKRHCFHIGSKRIQFNIHIEQRERSKKKFAFAHCKCTLTLCSWWRARWWENGSRDQCTVHHTSKYVQC